MVFRESSGAWLATMTVTVFGIPNCDTVKNARVWLDAAGVDYAFHDYKKAGVDAATLNRWAARS